MTTLSDVDNLCEKAKKSPLFRVRIYRGKEFVDKPFGIQQLDILHCEKAYLIITKQRAPKFS